MKTTSTLSAISDEATAQAELEVELTPYEFPLNERIRTLLRLEDLFSKFQFFVQKDHRFDHHTALLTLFEIVEVGSRADLKSDLMQELERQRAALSAFRGHPKVDRDALDDTLNRLDKVADQLAKLNGRLGHHLRDNDFLMIIRSRSSIPGGVCEFDLPGYHRWQSRNASQRRADIQSWFEPMRPLARAIELVLQILRNSGQAQDMVAEDGNFTQQMSGKPFQLLRIDVPSNLEVVPEFSANKYMLWVRFNVPNSNGVSKNNPCAEAVPFVLRLCTL